MPLEKTQENLTTCQICKERYYNKHGIASHIRKHQITSKDYYDKFYKQENEGICLRCGKYTTYNRHNLKYGDYCSAYCVANSVTVRQKYIKSCLKQYGCSNPNQNTSIREKTKQTNLKRYGVENPAQNHIIAQKISLMKTNISQEYCDKITKQRKETCMERYGVDCYGKTEHGKELARQMEKKYKPNIQQNNVLKYGFKSPFGSPEIQEKIRQTNIKKYGVPIASQNKEVQEKAFKSSHQSKPYRLPSGKIVYKMGYEPQFLNYVFKNNILTEDEIDYHPDGIKYIGIDGKQHHYFPDFYIPKWNLIVEIKSDWIMRWDKNVYLKESTAKQQNYNYIRIINNVDDNLLNFNNFEQYWINN